jgi:hypothetical protein
MSMLTIVPSAMSAEEIGPSSTSTHVPGEPVAVQRRILSVVVL